jgi:hypothetical protein
MHLVRICAFNCEQIDSGLALGVQGPLIVPGTHRTVREVLRWGMSWVTRERASPSDLGVRSACSEDATFRLGN